MSEHLVHTAVLEDSVLLMPYVKAVPKDFVDAINKHFSFARLGCVTISGDRFSFSLLEQYKSLWKNHDDLLEAKLSFVLGWVSHRACDRIMKPVFAECDVEEDVPEQTSPVSPTDCSIYHEGAIYNSYFYNNPAYRFALFPEQLDTLPGRELFNLNNIEKFMENSFAVNMMNIQTFPFASSDAAFFENLFSKGQKFYVDVTRYSKAACFPNPDLKKRYLLDINWYNDSAKIIEVVNNIRQGKSAGKNEMEEALSTEAKSFYGEALQLSLRYICTAAEYFYNDAITMDDLKDRLDIGKKGRNGLSV